MKNKKRKTKPIQVDKNQDSKGFLKKQNQKKPPKPKNNPPKTTARSEKVLSYPCYVGGGEKPNKAVPALTVLNWGLFPLRVCSCRSWAMLEITPCKFFSLSQRTYYHITSSIHFLDSIILFSARLIYSSLLPPLPPTPIVYFGEEKGPCRKGLKKCFSEYTMWMCTSVLLQCAQQAPENAVDNADFFNCWRMGRSSGREGGDGGCLTIPLKRDGLGWIINIIMIRQNRDSFKKVMMAESGS